VLEVTESADEEPYLQVAYSDVVTSICMVTVGVPVPVVVAERTAIVGVVLSSTLKLYTWVTFFENASMQLMLRLYVPFNMPKLKPTAEILLCTFPLTLNELFKMLPII
jgi:hypothetical protein